MKPKIKVRGNEVLQEVEINSELGNEIKVAIIDKWQEILDLATQMFDVPNALIMRLHENDLEVFAKSSNKDNIFEKNKQTEIGVGHYCETVIGKNEMLLVPNALKDPMWEDNPDIKFGTTHYLGFPLQWPDGEMFGTMCILDSEEKDYSEAQFDLFKALKSTIEKDLSLVDRNVQLSKAMTLMEKTQDLLVSHEKNHLTNQLVSSITHEISTPIGVALTTASYLDYIAQNTDAGDEAAKEKLQEGAELLQRNLEQASKLIRSFKEIANGQGKQTVETVDLYLYIESVVSSLKYDLRKYNIDVKVSVPEYSIVRLNSGALGQVLINLIVNASHHAFKTMEDNKIEVTYIDEDDWFTLTIEDNGVGMTEEEISHIFEAFVRYDMTTDGSGLGLTIVKDLVLGTLKGIINCESTQGTGTKFIIQLPKESSD